MNCCPSGFSYGAPVCVALSTGEPVQYKTKINSDQSITYVDSAGVESSSLPVGSSAINCSQITWVANQTDTGTPAPTGTDCNGDPSTPVYDVCAVTAINTAKDAIVAAINGRPDYTAQLTSIGDTLTAMKSDTAAINTGVASSLVLLQAIVDKPDPTPVDLQPVLDRLNELIALDTTENSTLVDVKNQLIAANVTLSNVETLLTHIDADMHDVVAKLQVALDLLASLQTLLTTIDGRIAAIQAAITTADANNVSALNDIRTELQAINVNTDTLEALITAGNVLLTAIASNTDGVEGLLTEIRDRPVTDSWLLLYDNNDGSIGGCKPFIRRIVDNVVTDTELDLTTPYTVVGEVRTSCPDAQTEPTCTCTDELQAVKTSIIEHLPLVECDVETSPAVDGQQLIAFGRLASFGAESGWSVNFAPAPTLPYSKSNTIENYLTLVYTTALPIPVGSLLRFNTTTPLSDISVGFDSRAFTDPTMRQPTVPSSVTAGAAQQVALPNPLAGDSQTSFVVRVASSQVGQISGVSIWSPETEAVIDTTTAVLTALDACSVTRIKDALTDLPVSVAPLEQPTHTPVSVTSGSYTLAAGVKSYSITFVDKGAISGAYRPAGYSTNADYVEQGYATALTVTGTSFIIEEVR